MINLKKWNIELSKSLIIELLKYLIIFLIIDGGIYLITQKVFSYLSILENRSLFWFILLLSALLVFILMFQKFNRNIPYFPAINSDFQILELEIVHHVKSKNQYNHKRKYKLKAKRNGLRRYQGRFSWTGDNFDIKSGDDKHNVFLTKKINVFNTYIIDFDRVYKKNEIIEAVVEWNLVGEGEPFISAQIQEPTNKLILSVEFNNTLKIKNVEFEETYTPADSNILNYTNLVLTNNCTSQVINNPKLLHLYEIRWKW